MGLTHYWKLHGPISPGCWDEFTTSANRLIASRSEILSRAGDPSEPPTVNTERVVFNGRSGGAREVCEIRRVPEKPGEWMFCKTYGMPYDEVVMAVLISLKLVLGEEVELRSDSSWHSGWAAGRQLVEEQLGSLPEEMVIMDATPGPAPALREFSVALSHFLGLSGQTAHEIARGLVAEARDRLGVDLAAAGFFLMPREMFITRMADGSSELAVDVLAPDDAFSYPAKISWHKVAEGEIRSSWLEFPAAELSAFIGEQNDSDRAT